MSAAFRLFLFILASAALHAFLLLEYESRVPSDVKSTGRTTVVPILTPPPREAKQRPPPTRTPAGAAPAPRNSGKEKKLKKRADALPRLTRMADRVGMDPGRRSTGTKQSNRPAPPDRRPDRGRVQTPFATRKAYFERLVEKLDQAPLNGVVAPDLITDDQLRFEEVLDIVSFYGGKVVAYPQPQDGAPTYYLELGGEGLSTATRREGPDRLEGFSNRARDLTGHPGFWSVLARVAARHHLDPYHACIAAVVPKNVDRYFLYKQAQAAALAGLDLGAVRSTKGRFRPTNVGWMLEIYAVTPIHGPTRRITTAPEDDWR